MSRRLSLYMAILVASTACDGLVRARVKVVSTSGSPISDAVIRLDRSPDYDLARFTDNRGCAYFSGVVAPGRHVAVAIDKPGYQSKRLKLPTIQNNCLQSSTVVAIDDAACDCATSSGNTVWPDR